MDDDRVLPACQIDIESEPPVRVWVSGKGIVAPARVGECVRASLGRLEGEWAYELHQYLANSGNAALLYRLDCGEGQPLAVSVGDFRAPFGQGLMLGARVSSRERVQLGVSVLTAFALSLSQGTDPVAICMADLGQRIRELDLPV